MNGIFIKGSLASLRDDNLFFTYLWEEAAIRRMYLMPQLRLLLRIAASSPYYHINSLSFRALARNLFLLKLIQIKNKVYDKFFINETIEMCIKDSGGGGVG